MRVERFSEDYAGGGTFVRRMDARAKLVFSAACVAVVIASPGPLAPVFVGALCLATLAVSGTPLTAVFLRMSGPLVFASVIAVFQAFLVSGEPLTGFSLAGLPLTASVQGVHKGVVIISHVFGASMAVLFLTMTTPAYRLLSAAARLRVPKGFVEVSLLTYRYIFVLLEDAVTVYHAQKGRLGYAGLGRAFKSLGMLSGSVLLRAYSQAEATGAAMALRGYTGEYVPAFKERLSVLDALFLCGTFTLCLAMCIWTS